MPAMMYVPSQVIALAGRCKDLEGTNTLILRYEHVALLLVAACNYQSLPDSVIRS